MGWTTNENGQLVWDGNGPEPGSSGQNLTGANTNPADAIWKGAQRTTEWMPPQYLQTYGNYTGLFPSMGQQVGQALWGSIQAQNSQPAWMQTKLPSRQNNTVSMNKYSPFQSGIRTMNNPYPLNGTVNITTPNIGYVSKAGNPFIGQYQGLGNGASPGGGAVGGNGLTPGSWGTPYTPDTPPPNPNPPPSPLPTGGGTAPTTGGGLPPPSSGTANPYQRPPVYSQPPPSPLQYPGGRPTTGNPAQYVPPTPYAYEPAPGSGGMTGGPSMGGQAWGSTTAGPGGPINPDNTVGQMRPAAGKQMQISPAMIQGLLSYFGGGK